MSEGGEFCEPCGGHGVYMERCEPDDPKRIQPSRPCEHSRLDVRCSTPFCIATPAVKFVRCRYCDGRDRVTPLMEMLAEDSP